MSLALALVVGGDAAVGLRASGFGLRASVLSGFIFEFGLRTLLGLFSGFARTSPGLSPVACNLNTKLQDKIPSIPFYSDFGLRASDFGLRTRTSERFQTVCYLCTIGTMQFCVRPDCLSTPLACTRSCVERPLVRLRAGRVSAARRGAAHRLGVCHSADSCGIGRAHCASLGRLTRLARCGSRCVTAVTAISKL